MRLRPALLLGLVLGPPLLFTVLTTAEAQLGQKTVTIGYLGNSSATLESNQVEAFRQGLRDLGYEEPQNLVLKYQWAQGRHERLPELAAEFVRIKVDAIVTGGTPATLAAKRATTRIPIVMVGVGDPLGAGLVSSLAKPGANVTGLATLARELEGKRLEFLKEVVPRVSRVAALMNPVNPFTALAWRGMQPAAEALGMKLEPVEVQAADEFDQAFTRITTSRADALILIADRFLLTHRARIAELALRHRLPGVFPFAEFAHEGGLMAYAPNYPDMYRRAATFVDRIARGAKPGDLPVEQPTKFELVINRASRES